MTRSGGNRPVRHRALLYLCFFSSGIAGLTLEIVWSKYLSYLLGNSIYGVATVVAAFLGGLGLGAVVGGRLSSRTRQPLLMYARLEILVAAMGLLSPLAYLIARPLFASLYGAMGGSGVAFLLVRFAILFLALLIPTIAMGATLPLLVSGFTRREGEFGSSVSRLYAINTAGAVCGVALAGFVLIPALGLWKTAAVAAGIDLLVAAAVFGAKPAPSESEVPAAASEKAHGAEPGRGGSLREAAGSLILPAFAVSGFCAILYEVAWTRILSIPFGGMVYSFSSILAVYLLGIALGAALAVLLLRLSKSPVLLFGLFQLLLAGAVVLGSRVFATLPDLQATLIAQSRGSATRLFAGEAAVAARIVLLPTFFLGALFPLAAAIYQRGRRAAGASVGTVYAANTVGSIAGSILTGFVLIPAVGSLRAILAAALANATIGCLALLLGEGARWKRALATAAAVACVTGVALFATPAWQAERMSFGFVRLLRAYEFGGEGLVHRILEKVGHSVQLERLLFYREGRVATVTVLETGERGALRRALLINGKTDATTGSGEDMAQQVLVGQVPLLLAPNAKRVCVVGYGSGVTTHAVLTHPIERALTLELEGAVIEAAPFFEAAAHRPLADPRSRLVVEDAGTYLRSTKENFDVIISEPSNPWIAGVGNLFTKEFYEEARRRLTPGGVFCQWIQTYSVSPATLSTVFRTVATTFPHGQLFYVESSGDLIILAVPDRELLLDRARMEAVFQRPGVAADFARIGVHSVDDVLGAYRGRLDRLAREAGPGPINTDDNSWLEHEAPLDLITPQEENPILERSPQVEADLRASLR